MTPLVDLLRAVVAREFRDEHLQRLASRLTAFHRAGGPVERPLPHFTAEVTPPVGPVFDLFREAIGSGDHDALKAAVQAAGVDGLLLLLGQRRTPASLTDVRGIPPTRDRLIASANCPHLGTEKLTVAGRALTKHVHRSPDQFWGEVGGPAEAKNAAALAVITRILDDATWWNVFGHYQHDTVFEARVPTGHGARWAHHGDEFIGFLEPFLE